MITILQILSALAILATTLVTFGAGYLTAYYIQYLKIKHNTKEESKEIRA